MLFFLTRHHVVVINVLWITAPAIAERAHERDFELNEMSELFLRKKFSSDEWNEINKIT